MNKVYHIKKATEIEFIDSSIWDTAQTAEICCFPWDKSGYKPKTEARVLHTEKGLNVYLISYENEITASYTKMNDPVHKDSCMEFFFKPNPEEDDRYLNFEFNPLGTLTLGLGKDRFGRLRLPESTLNQFNIRPSVKKDEINNFSGSCWSINFSIPYCFIKEYFGKINIGSRTKMTGNFYKCGDNTKFTHYGCWNKVGCEKPDFHRPEYFGDLILDF